MNKTEMDTLQDVYKVPQWQDVSKTRFYYDHDRDLPNAVAQEAIAYIEAITKQYPFQLRYTMALPLWKRFTQEWCDTGDAQKSLRVI